MTNEENNTPENEEEQAQERTEFPFKYRESSGFHADDKENHLDLHGNIYGASNVFMQGKVKNPGLFRAALTGLYDVVKSDQRYVPRDRTAYLAFKAMKRESAGMQAWEARQAYFDWLERNDPLGFMILDPIVSVFPDELYLEVFSKDEGVYAGLSINYDIFEDADAIKKGLKTGTTNIDYSQELFDGILRMRSYRDTVFKIESESVALETKLPDEEQSGVVEKKVKVPDAWLRGFLQIQSAGLHPKQSFKLAPMDLYNILRQLRLNADQKRKGRALRVELVPGEYPRLVLEPWDMVIETKAELYKGDVSQVVRLWGRRRLKLLERLLPMADDIEVFLMGSGLPSFFVLSAGPVRLTLCLTGFSTGNWAQTTSFDLLLPRADKPDPETPRVIEFLAQRMTATLDEIADQLSLDKAAALRALQSACQQGLVIYDLRHFRFRPLSRTPLNLSKFQFRNIRERQAHDIVAEKAVRIEMENRIYGVGTELTGLIQTKGDERELRPLLLVDDEGRALKAECTCLFYRKKKLQEGPCEHMIALRIAHSQAESVRDPDTIKTETRTFARRLPEGQHIYKISLEERRLKKRWGPNADALRKQCLVYNSIDEARDAYYSQIQGLEAKGYQDTTR